jgi:hypothetical protein
MLLDMPLPPKHSARDSIAEQGSEPIHRSIEVVTRDLRRTIRRRQRERAIRDAIRDVVACLRDLRSLR